MPEFATPKSKPDLRIEVTVPPIVDHVAVGFDAESALYQGYARLSPEQRDQLAAVAADIFGEFDHGDAFASAFEEAANRLGFKSDVELEMEEEDA